MGLQRLHFCQPLEQQTLRNVSCSTLGAEEAQCHRICDSSDSNFDLASEFEFDRFGGACATVVPRNVRERNRRHRACER